MALVPQKVALNPRASSDDSTRQILEERACTVHEKRKVGKCVHPA